MVLRDTAVTPNVADASSLGSASWIQQSPDVCGGDACIRNTRITVWGLAQWRKLGLSDERILEIIDGLTPDDLAVAWDYNRNHPDEIDETIRQNQEA